MRAGLQRAVSKAYLAQMASGFLLYGANGYTGELLAKLAKQRGLAPILAARREDALRPLAEQLGFAYRVFGLDDARAIDAALAEVGAVLHCAGPFSQTSRPMADACLRSARHYLDVTGEVAVFEALFARDAEAKRAGITLLPGVGFDVVPSDCLAAHMVRRLPGATHLRLAFQAKMGVSRGTAKSTIEGFGRPNLVRRDGALVERPLGALAREIDFGTGPVGAVSIPWGDVSTAYHSTGIPNIEVYVAAPAAVRFGMKLSAPFGPLLRSEALQNFLKRRVQSAAPGPSEAERARGKTAFWAEASDDTGTRVVSRQTSPEGYSLTIETALESVQRVLAGEVSPGFQTPSRAFGPDFILQFAGVSRSDAT